MAASPLHLPSEHQARLPFSHLSAHPASWHPPKGPTGLLSEVGRATHHHWLPHAPLPEARQRQPALGRAVAPHRPLCPPRLAPSGLRPVLLSGGIPWGRAWDHASLLLVLMQGLLPPTGTQPSPRCSSGPRNAHDLPPLGPTMSARLPGGDLEKQGGWGQNLLPACPSGRSRPSLEPPH